MERYNREFNDLFDSPKPGLFVFCERVREEAALQEKLSRLKERQRIEREVRLLGAIARVAGLARNLVGRAQRPNPRGTGPVCGQCHGGVG